MKPAGQLRKLNLNRETIAPLSAAQLDDVNGGTGALCRFSVRASVWVSQKTVKVTEQVLESARYSCFC